MGVGVGLQQAGNTTSVEQQTFVGLLLLYENDGTPTRRQFSAHSVYRRHFTPTQENRSNFFGINEQRKLAQKPGVTQPGEGVQNIGWRTKQVKVDARDRASRTLCNFSAQCAWTEDAQHVEVRTTKNGLLHFFPPHQKH